MRRTLMHAVTVASLFVMFSCLSAAAQAPDAILKVHTTSIAAGVGYSWGGGMLTFQGPLLLDSGGLCSTMVREAHFLIEGH